MSSISNRFFVTSLEDGTTLHGNLVSDKPLVQSWNGTAAQPNWSTDESTRPTIHLTLLSGNMTVNPANIVNQKWYYNGSELTFAGGSSTDTSGRFQKTTAGGMPALKIIQNLVSASGSVINLDMDYIEFKASYNVSGGASIPFQSSIQVRITEITANGYLGLINFVNGISDITTAGQTIVMYASLFGGADGSEILPSEYTVNWYINGTLFNAIGFPNSSVKAYNASGNTTGHACLELNEADVTDHATIRCEFVKNSESVYNDYVGVDDMQDPEFMYIQYNSANGNAASLRVGNTVEFLIWVGLNNDATVIRAWNNFKVQLHDAEGTIMRQSNLEYAIPNCDDPNDPEGWRTLNRYNSGANAGKAYIGFTYEAVNDPDKGKKNITGIVVATQV